MEFRRVLFRSEICHHLPSRNFSPSPDFPSPEQRRSLPVGVTQGQGMEIRQKKNSNKIRFVFGEEALDYSLEDSSGSRSYSVPYTDISRDRQTLVEIGRASCRERGCQDV